MERNRGRGGNIPATTLIIYGQQSSIKFKSIAVGLAMHGLLFKEIHFVYKSR